MNQKDSSLQTMHLHSSKDYKSKKEPGKTKKDMVPNYHWKYQRQLLSTNEEMQLPPNINLQNKKDSLFLISKPYKSATPNFKIQKGRQNKSHPDQACYVITTRARPTDEQFTSQPSLANLFFIIPLLQPFLSL